VYWLGLSGLKPKEIAKFTDIPYETVCQWKYQKALSAPKGFHNLTVTAPAILPAHENATVTIKSEKNPKILNSNATVTVTTPDGFLIEGLPAHLVIELIRAKVG
jgi:hypothetical protein